MRNWLNTRVAAALFAGLLAGGVAVTGVAAFADEGAPAQVPLGCTTGEPGAGNNGGLTFGSNRPWAV
jgi:hypothetical protein